MTQLTSTNQDDGALLPESDEPTGQSTVTRQSVDALFRAGGIKSVAAEELGRTPTNLNTTLKRQDAIELLKWRVNHELMSMAPQAVATLRGLLTARSEKVRLDAVGMVLDQGMYREDRQVVSNGKVQVSINLGRQDEKVIESS